MRTLLFLSIYIYKYAYMTRYMYRYRNSSRFYRKRKRTRIEGMLMTVITKPRRRIGGSREVDKASVL